MRGQQHPCLANPVIIKDYIFVWEKVFLAHLLFYKAAGIFGGQEYRSYVSQTKQDQIMHEDEYGLKCKWIILHTHFVF